MKELISKIEKWANDRNIIKGSKPIDQAMKLFSEFGELADNIGKGRDCRDDIGDCLVVLIIMCKQVGFDFNEHMRLNLSCDQQIKQNVVDLVMVMSAFVYLCDQGADATNALSETVAKLKLIAEDQNTTLQECLEIAYNDIKDRNGVMHNGVFVKESDPVYQSIVKFADTGV